MPGECLIDNLPPQALEMEQATLGSMLIEREAIERAAVFVCAGDFYRSAHGAIYSAMRTLYDRSEPVDHLTLQEELRGQGILDVCGGLPYLVQLTDAVPAAANVEHYARIVAEMAERRRLIGAARQIEALAYGDAEDLETLRAQAQTALSGALGQSIGQKGPQSLADMMPEAMARIRESVENGGRMSGLETGIEELDYLLGGLIPGQIAVICGRPGMGKTAMETHMALHIARRHGRVLIFSADTDRAQLVQRMICSVAEVSTSMIRNGTLSPGELRRVEDRARELARLGIWVDDSADLSAPYIRRYVARIRPICVIIDYIQYMVDEENESRHNEIAAIMRRLTGIAREFHIPLIALSQLSRNVENRSNKRPIMSDLRDSGSIEAEAKAVVGLYRAGYYREQSGEKPAPVQSIELIVLKNNNGPTGVARIDMHMDKLSFHEPMKPGDPAPPSLPYREDDAFLDDGETYEDLAARASSAHGSALEQTAFFEGMEGGA